MVKLLQRISKWIPVYCWLPLIFELSFNTIVYNGCKLIAGSWHHYNIETAADRAIPFLPWTVLIYFGCFLFWGFNYIGISRLDKVHAYRFLSADFIAKVVCMIFFILLPTTNTRPEITGNGVFDWLMRFLYWIDTPDNLFPSIHCLCSWFCYIGLRGRKDVSSGWKVFSCVFACAVFVSVLTTKQHVLYDVLGGVILAECAFLLTSHTGISTGYGIVFERLTIRLFGRWKDSLKMN